MTEIVGKSFDEERALYASDGVILENCTFAGVKDGESALKRSKNITAQDCLFELRYPFWHTDTIKISDSNMTDTCRAALWYCRGISISGTRLHGIKALRECSDISICGCDIISTEFGWKSRKIAFDCCTAEGEYFLFETSDVIAEKLHLTGKYSFQYCKNAVIKNSVLNTKDAFWHSENVTVYDSVINGEYLGWYSKNLHLVRCSVTGTQPLCCAEGLVLEDCTMTGCDLSFEHSDVSATVNGSIDSVKNPASGFITADIIDEIILDELPYGSCKITQRI